MLEFHLLNWVEIHFVTLLENTILHFLILLELLILQFTVLEFNCHAIKEVEKAIFIFLLKSNKKLATIHFVRKCLLLLESARMYA